MCVCGWVGLAVCVRQETQPFVTGSWKFELVTGPQSVRVFTRNKQHRQPKAGKLLGEGEGGGRKKYKMEEQAETSLSLSLCVCVCVCVYPPSPVRTIHLEAEIDEAQTENVPSYVRHDLYSICTLQNLHIYVRVCLHLFMCISKY